MIEEFNRYAEADIEDLPNPTDKINLIIARRVVQNLIMYTSDDFSILPLEAINRDIIIDTRAAEAASKTISNVPVGHFYTLKIYDKNGNHELKTYFKTINARGENITVEIDRAAILAIQK
jgi:hypothetical protein